MISEIKLSPSEVLLLHGDSMFTGGELRAIGSEKKYFVTRYGEKGIAREGYTKILGADVLVPVVKLAQMIFAAAFLGCEQSQLIRMEIKKDEWAPKQDTIVLTGLKLNESLYPEHTLENRIHRLVKEPPRITKSHQLPELTHELFEHWGSDPYLTVVEMAKSGLANRGLLIVHEYRGASFLTMLIAMIKNPVEIWTTNTQIFALRSTAATEIAAVKQLLLDCQTRRTEFWEKFISEISFGINSRKTPRLVPHP